MKRVSFIIAILVALGGATAVQAASGQQVFMASVDKALKISAQMASGKVPYNPQRAAKEMNNIKQAVANFEANGLNEAPKKVAACALRLKTTSTKGVVAAKAGQGAFKAVYGDLVRSFKGCS